MTDDNKSDSDKKKAAAADLDATLIADNAEAVSAEGLQQKTTDSRHPADLFDAKPMPKMPAKRNRRQWIGRSLLILLLLAALLVSLWVTYQQWIFQNSWQQLQNGLQTQIKDQNSLLKQANDIADKSLHAVSQTQLQLNLLSAKVQQSEQMLLSTQERIKSLSGRQKQDWMLAEVAHLIKLAQMQLSFQRDKNTAMQLLKTADRRLIAISDNRLLPIREAIALDLSELNLIVEADTTGVAMRLSAISQSINQLTLAAIQIKAQKPQPQQAPQDEALEAQPQAFNWHQMYQDFLQDFVVIKDYSEPVKPLITPAMRQNLVSNIQLALQQAEIALLQANQTLFQNNVEKAIDWIHEFYSKDEKAEKLLIQLNQIKSTPVDIRYPEKLHSQQSLQAISQQQLYRWLESSLGNSSAFNQQVITDTPKTSAKTETLTDSQPQTIPAKAQSLAKPLPLPINQSTDQSNDSTDEKAPPEAKP